MSLYRTGPDYPVGCRRLWVAAEVSEPGAAAGHVLIVVDQPALAELLAHHVRHLGLRPLHAIGGDATLESLASQPADLVILDQLMSDVSGIELCRRLRSRSETALLPILMVTTEADEETRIQAFEAGVDDFIERPYSGRELRARVSAHLRMAHERMELARLNGVLATIRLVSHEFNNPLQSVVGGLQLLEMSRSGGQVDEQEAMAMITQGSDQLHELALRLVQITSPCFKPSPIGSMLDIEESR